jgi:hypothetical protein
MFLRRFVRKKSGQPHTCWALAKSYRTARGSRQRNVAYLGELGGREQDGWTQLCSHFNGVAERRHPQRSLFDPPHRDRPHDDEPLLVKLSRIRLERTRDFREVWLAWGLWRTLGLDDLLGEHLESGREDVLWATVAAILTIARFCEPSRQCEDNIPRESNASRLQHERTVPSSHATHTRRAAPRRRRLRHAA